MSAAQPRSADARFAKAERRLHDAAIALAAHTPLDALTVTAVTREAGVNRATFYNHARTPAHLLQSALRADLDRMRAEFLASAAAPASDLHELWATAATETADHVGRYARIYAHDFDSDHGAVSTMLAQHISQSMLLLMDERPDLLPPHPDLTGEFLRSAYADSLGAGLTAVLRAWYRRERHDLADYIAAVLDTLPMWMLTQTSPAHNAPARTMKEPS